MDDAIKLSAGLAVTVLEGILRSICQHYSWDFREIHAMATGKRPATVMVVEAFASLFQVPRDAWPIRAPIVSIETGRYTGDEVTTTERKAILRHNGRRRRQLGTPVHEVLDRLDWSIADLAAQVSATMGKKVSRASVQFWATGTRQVGPKGKSRSHAVQAPLEVRVAAEKVTKLAARRRKLGPEAVLRRDLWPNVEPE